ncbi:MAG TPA: peptidylprolyl isomerase, partial [Clostridiaceae bacterium]|nr:peptidylprolyl isomerase [Clostridiaceae bacterium]
MTNTKRRLTLFAALIIALGILASGCSLIQKTPEAIAKQKVAKVGNEYITRGELDELVNYQKGMFIAQYGLEDNYFESTDGKEMLSNIKKQLLDSMIDQK